MAIAATTSLRKACRNCTKRKRKCIVELPKCQRCRQRNLECIYDLEPLVTSNGAMQRRRKTHACIEPSKSNDTATHRFLDYISSLHMSDKIYACLVNRNLVHSLTAIPLRQDPEAVHYIMGEMRHIPGRAQEGK